MSADEIRFGEGIEPSDLAIGHGETLDGRRCVTLDVFTDGEWNQCLVIPVESARLVAGSILRHAEEALQ